MTRYIPRLAVMAVTAAALATPLAAHAQTERSSRSQHSIAAEVHAAIREAEVAIREGMREAAAGIREAEREIQRDARVRARQPWAARTWAEGQAARRGPEQTERIARTFRVGASGSLYLSNVAGDIVVTEGGGDTISVEAIKRTRGRDAQDVKDQLARTHVSMVERGGRVEVNTTYTGNRNHASVDYNVTAPAGTSVSVNSVSGDVRVTGIRGELRVETVSGNVTATGATGAARLKSVSGDVEASGVATETELRAESVSGDVVVHGAKVRGLSAETVSGDVRLSDVATDRVSAGSVSGSVHYAGTVTKGGRYELKSHSGTVRLSMTADVGFELDARTFSGNIRSDLPLTVGGPGREAVRASRSNRGLRGVHGDGGAFLSLSSFSGDIVVERR